MDPVSSPAAPPVETDHEEKQQIAADAQSPLQDSDGGRRIFEPSDAISIHAQDQAITQKHEQDVTPVDVERSTAASPNDDFPEGGLQAWLVLTGSFLALFASFGFMVSVGVCKYSTLQSAVALEHESFKIAPFFTETAF